MRRFVIVAAVAIVLLAGLPAHGQVKRLPARKVEKLPASAQPTGVKLNKSEIWLFLTEWESNTAMEPYQLTAAVLPETAADKTVAWESLDPGVAKVNPNGKVWPQSLGTTVIKAVTRNGLAAECRVYVETRMRFFGNTSSNLLNRGYIAHQGEWLYFADPGRGMRLSKMKFDGSRLTPLCDDAASFINVLGSKIVYVNDADGSRLYAIDIYGENRRWLNDANPAYGAQLYGNEILYGATGPDGRINLYTIDLAGTNRQVVDWPGLGNVGFFYRVSDSVFYTLLRSGARGQTEIGLILYRPLASRSAATKALDATIKGFAVATSSRAKIPMPGRIFYISEAGEVRRIDGALDPDHWKDVLIVRPNPPAKGMGTDMVHIYYYTENSLNKVMWDGTGNQNLVRIPAGATVLAYPLRMSNRVADTVVYYYVMQKGVGPRLFRVRNNGLDNIQVR